MPRTLTVTTPVGDFTRATDLPYAFAVVWQSPRAMLIYEQSLNPPEQFRLEAPLKPRYTGLDARWVKDRGHGVTWHRTLHAAQKTTKKYPWDYSATCLGVFAVNMPPDDAAQRRASTTKETP